MDFETIALLIFILLLVVFVAAKRKQIQFQGIFPLFYLAMYRTKMGIKSMESWADKFSKPLKVLAYIGVAIGFVGMIFISYLLIENFITLIFGDGGVPGIAPVLPIRAKGVFYVPFFYWIISIFIIALVHEFAHGLIANIYKLKVKSSGFAFLGILVPIIPAAFVEPDEKKLQKRPMKQQLSIFAAGPFANLLLAGIAALLFIFLFNPLVNSAVAFTGVGITQLNETSPLAQAGVSEGEIITEINGVTTLYFENITDFLEKAKPGQEINLTTNKTYLVMLGERPDNRSKAYLGAYLDQKTEIRDSFKQKYGENTVMSALWIIGLFYWLLILNLGIGLFNLLPLGPIDGGRMVHVVLLRFFEEKKAQKYFKWISLFFLFLIIVLLWFGFVK